MSSSTCLIFSLIRFQLPWLSGNLRLAFWFKHVLFKVTRSLSNPKRIDGAELWAVSLEIKPSAIFSFLINADRYILDNS